MLRRGPGEMIMVSLSYFDLLTSVGLLVVVLFISIRERLGLGQNLVMGTLRTFAQLILVGYLLKLLFAHPSTGWVLFTLSLMTTFAIEAAVARQKPYLPGSVPVAATGIVVGAAVTLAVVIGAVIRPAPWFRPQYVIPLAGMIIGNSMNGAALLLNRLQGDMKHRRAEIEVALALGATSRQAAASPMRDAVRASMLPTINTMLTMGLVQLPGMMTGQIIAGGAPQQAVRYQIMTIYMITAAVGMTIAVSAALSTRIFFTPCHQMRRLPE